MKKYLLVGAGTLIFLYFISKFDFKEIGSSLSLLGMLYVVSIILLNFPVLLLKTWRWKFLLSKYDLSPTFLDMFIAVSAGFFLGLVTPGTMGELSRTLTINIDKSKGVGTVIFEKFFDLFTLFILSIGSLLIYFLDPFESITIFLVVCLGSWGLIYFVSRKKNFLEYFMGFVKKLLPKIKLVDKLSMLQKIFVNLLRDNKLVILSIVVSLSLWLISGIQFYLILKALNVDPSFLMVCVCFFLPYLTGVLSFIPLGMGVTDFSMVGVMVSFYHITSSLSYTAVLAFRLYATIPLVIWGYLCYLSKIIYKKNTTVP